ncbi:MAG: hypothetical protein HC769_04200 [Cyanobacteria bacterium CRU_2_1]|nr:hypothetical protein [Cyanobacteria bacterium RU_5_0]NJR58119.1 hypothetical protein [Cyanobacteria bacterium CRU_2_1]
MKDELSFIIGELTRRATSLTLLWNGRLVRPERGRQDAYPTRNQDYNNKVAHRVN